MISQSIFEFKFVLIGDSSVGKSSILNRFVDDQFHDNLLATIGVDFKFRKMKVNSQDVKIQIWDTAGQQTFRSLVSAYYHSADAILIVYDITFYKSFESVLQYWITEAQKNNKNGACLFLIGNKKDSEKKEVESHTITQIACKHNIDRCFEVSAKTGQSIEQSFTEICKILISKNKGVKKINEKTKSKNAGGDNNFALGPTPSQGQSQNKKKCCQ